MTTNILINTFSLLLFSLSSLSVSLAAQYNYNPTFIGYPYAGQQCYPDGCVDYSTWAAQNAPAPQHFASAYDYINAVSVALNMADSSRGYLTDDYGRYIGLSCINSLIVRLACPNNAINPPACNQCGSGAVMQGGSCKCSNGAANPLSGCNQCPAGQAMIDGICRCANGAEDPPSCSRCPSAASMISGQCTCANLATPHSNCTQCPAGKSMHQGTCRDACTLTNVCGQQKQGVILNGACLTGEDNPNNSCITFKVSTQSVIPNGSVEFEWKIANLPANVGSKCGFVDLTTPTPRPIPGLQNIDATTDRTRITNIQNTTRFCLVCQFYNLTTQATLGDAAVHQWVRVQRIGEN